MTRYRTVPELINKLDHIAKKIESGQLSAWADLWNVATETMKLAECVRTLEDLLDGDDGDVQNPRALLVNAFGRVAQGFARYGLYTPAENVLIEVWNQLGLRQRDDYQRMGTSKHVYRAGVGVYLARIYLAHDPGAALCWLLHAHADDLLIPHGDGGGAARDMLRLVFDVADNVFDDMAEYAEQNRKKTQPFAHFAEHLVVQLSQKPEHSMLFARPVTLVEYPIGRAYAQTMVEHVKGTSDGRPLELLACYLGLLLAGWVPTSNVYHQRTRIESDIVLRYVREPEGISTAHGRALLVECKNIKDSLGVSDVGYFLYRMRLTQVKVGILFAKKHVSGSSDKSEDEKNAAHLLDLAFQRDDAIVVVIHVHDLG